MNRTAAAAVLTIAVGFGVAACGSSTVDSSEVATTTEATREQPASSTPATSAVTSTQASSSTAPAPAPAGGDQPAQEVESVPTQQHVNTPEEEAYLKALSEKGINVNGVEDQLTATALSLCEGTTITRDAVAGQLIEQRRTELAPEAISQLIDDSAREHIC